MAMCYFQSVPRRLRALEDLVNDLRNSMQSNFNRQIADLTNRVTMTKIGLNFMIILVLSVWQNAISA